LNYNGRQGETATMPAAIRIRLSIMMFLQFFVWGAWAVTMGTYLGQGLNFTGAQIGLAYSTTGWAAIISPFFVGMIADRFFQAQHVMGILHLLGAVLMYFAATITDPFLFFWVLLAYAICYMPTLALVNAIAFNQMENTEKEFPLIRVLGTIGWIVAGFSITFLGSSWFENIEATATPLKLAAGASLLLGIYSFLLPSTPPRAAGAKVSIRDILGLDALELLRKPSFAIFVLSSLLICIPLAFYYAFTNLFLNESGITGVAAKMTMGQMSEVFFLLVMPFFFTRLGVKKMLLVGMGAWALRYLLFAYGSTPVLPVDGLAAEEMASLTAGVFMLYGGILLHGICFDFFFVTGQIYVDKVAPREIRANAQGLIALVTYGVGMVIGNYFAGKVVDRYTIVNEANEVIGHAWQSIWLVPMFMAVAVLIFFALTFRDDSDAEASPGAH